MWFGILFLYLKCLEHNQCKPNNAEAMQEIMEYLAIVLTLTVATVIIVGLLLCYTCVFRHMCCPAKPKKSSNRQGTYRRESISLKYLTHVSSQPTDTSIV